MIRLEVCGYGEHTVMLIDPGYVAECAGRRERDYGGSYTPYPLTRAKKLIKLILEYGSDEDIAEADKAFKANARLYKIWKKMIEEEKK